MKKRQLKPLITVITLSTLMLGSHVAQADFDNRDVKVSWEIWNQKSPGAGGALFGARDSESVVASNNNNPDITQFHSSTGNDYELWDIDFFGKEVILTYTSIAQQDTRHQYMYQSSQGFHFEDTTNSLGDITNVTVERSFAPFGFLDNKVTFDANNIWVDLKGSMCHTVAMGSMPTCTNPNSPTGYDNQIKLIVETQGGGAAPIIAPPIDNSARIDALFSWAEQNYPQFFPSRQSSRDILGYQARHYPSTNTYLGSKDGVLYVYGAAFGGMKNLGNTEQWLNNLGL